MSPRGLLLAISVGFSIAPAVAQALPTCADLATNPAYGLAGCTDVLSLTAVKITGASARE